MRSNVSHALPGMVSLVKCTRDDIIFSALIFGQNISVFFLSPSLRFGAAR